MKVVALLSGGKDSCYSILKSRTHGHDVVAIAHITPPKEEADSYMYQSVGSNAVPLIATALGLPLFSRATKARARQQQLFYTPTENDEVEDLVALLQTVKRACPQVQAVCSGALWSDYQRLRVESAVSRVGLLSLSYLWHRNQRELLDEMIDVGIHAVLVKVAGVGLNSKHLGKSLQEMRPTLHELEEKYGSYVCGEGGEFESLVLWMPGFQKRLVLDDTEIVLHSDDPYAPVSYLRINSCSLDELTEQQMQITPPQSVVAPEVFHPSVNWANTIEQCEANKKITPGSHKEGLAEKETLSLNVSVGSGNNFLFVSIQSPEDGEKGVMEAAAQLKRVLEKHNEPLASVVYVTLSLRSVTGASYRDANAGYNKLFAVPECTPPPSRACVAVSPDNHATTLEALVRRKRDRSALGAFTLHVQSLSEWAPPCIGPYAQFVEEDGIVHVSGVLPLYAPTATVPDKLDGRAQVVASLYNLERTLEASHSSLRKMGLFIAYAAKDCLIEPVREELNTELNKRGVEEDAVVMVLPISALPKGALVEIRAIGVVNESDLQFPERDKDTEKSGHAEYRSVVCGSLGFAICTGAQDGSIDDLKCTLGSILHNWLETKGRLISIQLYYSKALCADAVRALLETRAPGAAITLIKCHEPCGSPSTRCIAVHDLS
ncbi:Diphthamide synthase [Gracilaria domingensis]|nr:Diphthamide synthase [Gracilaria domingensis]